MGRNRRHRVTSGRRDSSVCAHKQRFRDKLEADRALHRIKSRSNRERIPQRAYFCPTCRGFHLSSREDRG